MSTAVAHRRALYGHNRNAAWQAYLEGELPEGYRRVEYIESTGVQWIDTGYVPTVDFDIDVAIDYTYYNQICYLFGCCSTQWNQNALSFSGNKDGNGGPVRVFVAGDSATPSKNGAVYLGDQWTVSTLRMSKNSLYVNNIQQLYNKNYTKPSELNISHPLYIFGRNNKGTADYLAALRLYRFIIGDSGVQLRHYIPCVRTSDSKPGMYDLCGSICPLTGTPFYINAGTGADFTYGEL